MPESLQADKFEVTFNLSFPVRVFQNIFQTEGNILLDSQPGEQGVLLKHHAPVRPWCADNLPAHRCVA